MSIGRLNLVGQAQKRDRRALVAAFGAAGKLLPDDYIELMATCGPGEICGFIELPDPIEAGGRHARLQAALRERGETALARGLWAGLTSAQLRGAALLGIDRMGAALVAVAEDKLYVLQPYGAADSCDSFDEVIDGYLLGWGLNSALRPEGVKAVVGHHKLELDVPRIYATDLAPNVEAWEALTRGDRAGAEAAVARFAGREVLPYAWIALMARVVTADPAAISDELREDMVADLYTLAKRRFPALGERIPQRELRAAVMNHEVSPDLRERLQAVCRVLIPTIFDENARMSDSASDAGASVDVDLVDRGLVAPAGYRVDVEGQLRAFVEMWRSADPTTPIEPLLDRLNALPRAIRDGYVMLVVRLHHNERLNPALRSVPDAEKFLGPEIGEAWPMLALALRSDDPHQAESALEMLREHHVTEAAPYLRSVIDHPATHTSEVWQGEVAYAELAELSKDETKAMFLRYVAPGSKASARQKQAAYQALEPCGDDDDVFAMFLASFGAAWPHSERAIENAKRWQDPRVIPALREALRAEARFAEAGTSKRDAEYSATYESILERLATLGDAEAKDTLAAYKRQQRRSLKRML